MNDFDPCPHKITQIILMAGRKIREIKGLPEERNITTLYQETMALLGMPVTVMDSRKVGRLPSPWEMKDSGGKFIVPRKDCPACNKKDGMVFSPICMSCKDSEGGRFKSAWKCDERSGGCSYMSDRSEDPYVVALSKLGVEIPTGTKESLGIKTITDEGLK